MNVQFSKIGAYAESRAVFELYKQKVLLASSSKYQSVVHVTGQCFIDEYELFFSG